MAQVTLMVGGRPHVVACRDGEEAHLERLGATLDRHWPTAVQAAGNNMGGERTMLFVALILADALEEAENRPAEVRDEAAMAKVAERLEAIAALLEDGS